ncbi:MAG TPA: c-type cytochrome, partial [Gammaproteobacteria bacterium]|nr:c-type cytochrome [Gammaproteobacteria bacterium]
MKQATSRCSISRSAARFCLHWASVRKPTRPGPHSDPTLAMRERSMKKGTWCFSTLWLLCSTLPAQAGDSMRGQVLYESRCSGCHSLDAHRVGPAHRGIVGRRAGAAPGYAYSAALKDASLVWNVQNLDLWLT